MLAGMSLAVKSNPESEINIHVHDAANKGGSFFFVYFPQNDFTSHAAKRF